MICIDNNSEYTDKIVKILEEHPEGLSITEIAEILKLHRHTTIKYIYQLIGANIISQRKVGPVKLCYLKESLVKNGKNSKVDK